jgi:hypothetical protein
MMTRALILPDSVVNGRRSEERAVCEERGRDLGSGAKPIRGRHTRRVVAATVARGSDWGRRPQADDASPSLLAWKKRKITPLLHLFPSSSSSFCSGSFSLFFILTAAIKFATITVLPSPLVLGSLSDRVLADPDICFCDLGYFWQVSR